MASGAAPRRVLLVGEGDFTFALALATVSPELSLTATGFDADASQRRSHYADHARMLKDLNALRVHVQGRGGKPASSVLVDNVLRDFETHANMYDSYGEKLEAKLAAEETAAAALS